MAEKTEAELVAEHVNRRPSGPTEPDEETVLRGLYGGPDSDGVYRGEPS